MKTADQFNFRLQILHVSAASKLDSLKECFQRTAELSRGTKTAYYLQFPEHTPLNLASIRENITKVVKVVDTGMTSGSVVGAIWMELVGPTMPIIQLREKLLGLGVTPTIVDIISRGEGKVRAKQLDLLPNVAGMR